MKTQRQSLIKPTVLNDVLKLPAKEMQQIMEKVALLQVDPLPDGKIKKHLIHKAGRPYRIRAGDYRIFYNFDQQTVLIYRIERRDESTYRGDVSPDDLPDADEFDALESQSLQDVVSNQPTSPLQASWETFTPDAPSTNAAPIVPTRPLTEPISITADLLKSLHVDKIYYPLLLPLSDGESLLYCKGVDPKTLEKVIEYFYPRSLTEVMQQHNLVLNDVKDLQRFKEGDLLSFLLELSPEQEKFANWSLRTTGPTLVKGGPGTGKSTVALYRIRSLLDQLLKSGQSKPKILFTTYTNALIKASEQQLKQLLGENARYVQVSTADTVARAILKSYDQDKSPELLKSYQVNPTIRQAIADTSFEGPLLERRLKQQTLERMGLDYLGQEFNTVIIGRQIATLEEYQKTSRSGRQLRLNATQRSAVWQVYQYWCRLLLDAKQETWQQRRVRAEALTKEGRFFQYFDAVIIDEAQDLDPSILRMLIQICKAPNRLFITADANQSIYGAGFSWSDIHQDLRFQGRTSTLRANYRSTAEIAEAAHSYLSHARLESEESGQQYINHGPRPDARAVSSSTHEIQLLASYFQQTSHDLHLALGSCAILCPSENVGRALASELSQRDLETTFMSGKELDLSHTGIKVLTLKSSKGLEFPIVALAGFVNSTYPSIPADASQDEINELIAREQRTLFVGMTRAMRALLIVIPHKASTPLLQGFDDTYWNLKRTI